MFLVEINDLIDCYWNFKTIDVYRVFKTQQDYNQQQVSFTFDIKIS